MPKHVAGIVNKKDFLLLTKLNWQSEKLLSIQITTVHVNETAAVTAETTCLPNTSQLAEANQIYCWSSLRHTPTHHENTWWSIVKKVLSLEVTRTDVSTIRVHAAFVLYPVNVGSTFLIRMYQVTRFHMPDNCNVTNHLLGLPQTYMRCTCLN